MTKELDNTTKPLDNTTEHLDNRMIRELNDAESLAVSGGLASNYGYLYPVIRNVFIMHGVAWTVRSDD